MAITNNKKFKSLHWTEHSKIKMRQYGLSKIKLINILHNPERQELGIVPGTVAVMKTNKTFKPKKNPGEIWIMYRDTREVRKIISAWRYPGVSKPGEEIPIPLDIRKEIISSKI